MVVLKKCGNEKAASEVKPEVEDILCCINNGKLQKCACVHLFACGNMISCKFFFMFDIEEFY